MRDLVEDRIADRLGVPDRAEHAVGEIFGPSELDEFVHDEASVPSQGEEQNDLERDQDAQKNRCGALPETE
ncbi:MAG: hypothetical protein EOQ32_00010 [Mesorhizobium sp.]|nr:MAG: hypothetical protein EOQ32_00010 [Mesorhizobium sp.]